MTIETKYNIGEGVWYKRHGKIFQDTICEIKVNIDCFGETSINYQLWDTPDVLKEESDLFSTKEELLKSL